MFGGHFYHASIRRFVSAFGSLFNDIRIIRANGSSLRVPLAYGPRDKFLARIEEQVNLEAPKVAIKLPRMSFEIMNISYDTQSKLNRNNRILVGEKVYYTYAPYNISINLSIMSKTQDDALQIIEQIVPYFQPEYTITIKESVSDLLKTDVPITLSTIDMAEDYEGDFMSRRAIIYTLSFDAKIRFYGPEKKTGVIKEVIVNTLDVQDAYGYEQYRTEVSPRTAQSNNEYSIIQEKEIIQETVLTEVFLQTTAVGGGNTVAYELLETITGEESGATARIEAIENSTQMSVAMTSPGRIFKRNEFVLGQRSAARRRIDKLE
jgi:hypothetical protein